MMTTQFQECAAGRLCYIPIQQVLLDSEKFLPHSRELSGSEGVSAGAGPRQACADLPTSLARLPHDVTGPWQSELTTTAYQAETDPAGDLGLIERSQIRGSSGCTVPHRRCPGTRQLDQFSKLMEVGIFRILLPDLVKSTVEMDSFAHV
ncbi:hypothetical protein J6590_004105 [Homalodisca vitripennis]|nr:hypothetical protein J6590_004105 [Homalodisca vitripennis]